jgi:hypothetical protein
LVTDRVGEKADGEAEHRGRKKRRRTDSDDDVFADVDPVVESATVDLMAMLDQAASVVAHRSNDREVRTV